MVESEKYNWINLQNHNAEKKEALKALYETVENRNTDDLVLRTDNGVQFRSREFQTRIRELDISHERTMLNTPEESSHMRAFTGH